MRYLSGHLKEVNFSGSYQTVFDDNGQQVEYQLEFDNSQIILENFTLDGVKLLHRGQGGYGWIMAEDIEGKAVKMKFQPSARELGVVARRDPVQHPYLQRLHDWAASVLRYEFGKTMGQSNLALRIPLPMPESIETDQIVPIFDAGLRRFGGEFIDTIKRDMRKIGYDIEELSVARPAYVVINPTLPGELVGIAAKEQGLPCVTDQHCMSQGMFRTLSLLIQLNYALLRQKPGCVLVDDIGEGLDFERSCSLIDVLRSKARESEVQLILSTNDRFVMNKVPLEEWLVLQRAGNRFVSGITRTQRRSSTNSSLRDSAISISSRPISWTRSQRRRLSAVNRLAIFTEGETEQLFVEWLVCEMVSGANLQIELRKARGGRSTRRRTRIVEAVADNPAVKYYVLIVDCGGDGGVKSRILEEYHRLAEFGYKAIIGLRDAPKRRADIPRLQQGLPQGVPGSPVPVDFVLAIMEIEAWFLAEHTHFQKINETLTPALIQAELGFDPSADDMRLRDRPAQDLDAAYQLVGERYQKGRAAQRTVYLLDCARIAFEMIATDPEIQRIIDDLNCFLQVSPDE